MKKTSWTVLFFFALLILAASSGLLAQDRSSITGIVKATAGPPIENVVVKITGDLLPAGRTFTTGKDGQFRLPGIPPGHIR